MFCHRFSVNFLLRTLSNNLRHLKAVTSLIVYWCTFIRNNMQRRRSKRLKSKSYALNPFDWQHLDCSIGAGFFRIPYLSIATSKSAKSPRCFKSCVRFRGHVTRGVPQGFGSGLLFLLTLFTFTFSFALLASTYVILTA